MSRKIYPDAAAALDGLLFDGMTVMNGGFGLCGNPENLKMVDLVITDVAVFAIDKANGE